MPMARRRVTRRRRRLLLGRHARLELAVEARWSGGAGRWLVLEVGEDGADAAVFGGGWSEAEFLEDAGDVFFDGGFGDDEGVGDALVGFAFGHGGEDVALAGAELVEGAAAAAAAEHPADDLGVQGAAAGGDAGDRF